MRAFFMVYFRYNTPMIQTPFTNAYSKLNTAQKEAVDHIDGPVMVIAGPGTGKTQVLALRIAQILQKTDTKADSILSLTFTNSGVRAMRDRLEGYIGADSHAVGISTFHSFALTLLEKYYALLDFDVMPTLLADDEAVFLVDEILHSHDWNHIRPRGNPTQNFGDLKQLISILKRERISVDTFLSHVLGDIKTLQEDPESISTRGPSKGSLKKEIEKKIDSLEKTREVVEFYRFYEEEKKKRSLLDYDDVLEQAVRLVEEYEDVRADIREEYLYVLVDEHQDSSGVQNSFLKAVWKDVEKPNIFVVGDDRQLIYGFSGASLSYFEEFSHMFGRARLITLTENYRSTRPILSLADDLLKSSITTEVLSSNKKGETKPLLREYAYPRDEILGAGLYFKEHIEKGVPPEECALLVPRNYHVRDAIAILQNLGLPVSSGKSVSLFSSPKTAVFLRVLGIIASPYDSRLLAQAVLDVESGIPILSAHLFLRNTKPDKITLEELVSYEGDAGLFAGEHPIAQFGAKLSGWVTTLSGESLPHIVAVVGNELLVDASKSTEELLSNVEIVRSFIHLATLFSKKGPVTLASFLAYIARLESYGTHIEQATFGSEGGVRVMTLHKSKGLEYDCVWVAHMNEETLMSDKKSNFTLPEKIKEHMRARDVLTAKRELYVAITRAKEHCVLSYASRGYTGNELEVAHIIRDLPEVHFVREYKEDTEKTLLSHGARMYTKTKEKDAPLSLSGIQELVRTHYVDSNVSVTLLNNFFECPWTWYFRNFLRAPETKGPSLVLGSAVHDSIDHILKSKHTPTQKEVEEYIHAYLSAEGMGDTKEKMKLTRDGVHAVMHWVESYYPNLAKDHRSEVPLPVKDARFPSLSIYGKIDLVEKISDGTLVVTDFKTGTPKTTSMIEKRDEEGRLSSLMRQLAMYSYLFRHSKEGARVSQSRLLFLEGESDSKNALYNTTITDEEIDLLVRDIKDYEQLLVSGEWVSRPCTVKTYGKGGGCEYCARARILGIEKGV